MSDLDVNKQGFVDALANNNIVLVDFWAPWCGPCRQIGPILEQFAKDNADVKVVKVNVDDEDELVLVIVCNLSPTSNFFINGTEARSHVGSLNRAQLEELVNPDFEVD